VRGVLTVEKPQLAEWTIASEIFFSLGRWFEDLIGSREKEGGETREMDRGFLRFSSKQAWSPLPLLSSSLAGLEERTEADPGESEGPLFFSNAVARTRC